MRTGILIWAVAAALAGGLVIAGCGGDDADDAIDEIRGISDRVEEATEQIEQAQRQVEEAADDASKSVEKARRECLQQVKDSPLDREAKRKARDLCRTGSDGS